MKVVHMPEPPEPKHSCALGLKQFYSAESIEGRQLPAGCIVACICGRRWKLINVAKAPMTRALANSGRNSEWRDNPAPGLLWDGAGHVVADWDDVKDVREVVPDVPS